MAAGRVPVSITLPAEVLEEIDKKAQEWVSDRSNTIKRIYLEWKQLTQRQPQEAPAVVEATSVEAEPVKEII